MSNINKRRVLIVAGVGIGLLIIGFLFLYSTLKPVLVTQKENQGLTTEFNIDYLKKFSVPEPGENIEGIIAIPKEAIKSNQETKSKLRIFEVKGENGLISPSDFRAYQNDILNIKLTAIDQDYNLKLETYNIEITVKKGETRIIEFQAVNPGIFNLYCSLCLISTKPIAKLIIVSK